MVIVNYNCLVLEKLKLASKDPLLSGFDLIKVALGDNGLSYVLLVIYSRLLIWTMDHDTYIRNMYTHKEQSLCFFVFCFVFLYLFKAFDQIESSYKLYFQNQKTPIFLHACTPCSELTSDIGNMYWIKP